MKYDFTAIEKKWQTRWAEEKTFACQNGDTTKPKFYGLVEFPYPSAAGLHVGHPRPYTAMDVIARKKRMDGYNVLFPIGYDAFGLPTENFAIKNHIHPAKVTHDNIENFRKQLHMLGYSFDWDRVVDTTDPGYYKWTQWIFLQLYKHGLAYKTTMPVNWCTSCKCVLANEEVVEGVCERCGSEVIRKEKSQWMLAITKYADRLIDDLDDVDYIERVKIQQRNWIGRSTGAEVVFKATTGEDIKVFTTRPDTLFGATYMVLSPEHALVRGWLESGKLKNADEVVSYQKAAASKSDLERTELNKDKTGVKLSGLTAVNPVNGKEIPIFISDYVMMGYGTGAIMAVPAHDQRDWDFAKAFGIDIIQVIKGGDIEKEAYTGDGEMINSDFLNGTDNKKESIEKMLEFLKERGIGEKGVQYKMKDWAFNRQRYWGEPIPIIHCPHCGMVAVPENELPLKLPDVENFEPGEGGESPLAKIDSFVNCTCPKCGAPAKRETDTMPQWAGSSWYFLRYIDPHNDKCFADKDKLKYWLPVDWYNGGMEHVTRHLIYSRFWHRFLYDIGEVPVPEPYAKRSGLGLVLGADGVKMSKSRGNVVDPDDVIKKYGADTLRTYIMFMSDYSASAPWKESGVKGCKRFLERVASLSDIAEGTGTTKKLESIMNKTVKKVSQDIEDMKFNTAIAAMMTCLNEINDVGTLTKDELSVFIRLLCPFAPHLCEEMWEQLGEEGLCSTAKWPDYDESKCVDDEIEIAVQVNGRVRDRFTVPADIEAADAIARAKALDKVKEFTDGMAFIKELYVPGKLVNLVVKPQ